MSSVYRPLDTAKGEIRLLRILPLRSSISASRNRERIQCILRYATLDELPYHALSYTWADDEVEIPEYEEADVRGNGMEILLDGEKITITRNLWVVFIHFRESSKDQIAPRFAHMAFEKDCWFWIDALCINQSDIVERNSQVLRMKSIYQNASSVRVWLGPDLYHPRLTTDLGLKVGEIIKVNTTTREPRLVVDDWIHHAIEDDALQGHWQALIWTFQQPYWERLWVVQELLCNKKAWAHIGFEIIPIQYLFFLVDASYGLFIYLSRLTERLLLPVPIYDISKELVMESPNLYLLDDISRYAEKDFSGHDLYRLHVRYRRQSCTDLRDKVYGLAGLARPYANGPLSITYELPVHEVYKVVAKYIIVGSERLEIICTPEQAGRSFLRYPLRNNPGME